LICTAQVTQRIEEAGMATKVTIALEDDLDGGPADETVRFAFGGAEYEIDLNKKNATAFRRQLAPYIEHARKAGGGQPRRSRRAPSTRRRSSQVRAWAKAQGFAVSERGRIPASVVAQYEAAAAGPWDVGRHRISASTPFGQAMSQATAAGLEVPSDFQRQLRELIDEGLTRNSESPDIETQAGLAVGRLMQEVIGMARERDEDVVGPELLGAALASLCPLWPIC
jgi:hypothetical protein